MCIVFKWLFKHGLFPHIAIQVANAWLKVWNALLQTASASLLNNIEFS